MFIRNANKQIIHENDVLNFHLQHLMHDIRDRKLVDNNWFYVAVVWWIFWTLFIVIIV